MTIPAARVNLTDTRATRRAALEWTNMNYGSDMDVTQGKPALYERRPVLCTVALAAGIVAMFDLIGLAVDILL